MANTLPLETLYRLYKAETGDIIDGTYMKMTGVFNTEGDISADANGVLNRKLNYTMAIKNVSVSETHFVVWEMKRAPTAGNDDSVTAYLEPFVDASITQYPTSSYMGRLNSMKCYSAW